MKLVVMFLEFESLSKNLLLFECLFCLLDCLLYTFIVFRGSVCILLVHLLVGLIACCAGLVGWPDECQLSMVTVSTFICIPFSKLSLLSRIAT